MQKIPLNLAKPGMKLAKPVARDNGMVLAGPGTELSEALISRLDGMGIDRIVIEGSLDIGGGDGTVFAARLERLDPLFRRLGDDAWMMQVKAFLLDYFTMKGAQAAALQAAASETPKG